MSCQKVRVLLRKDMCGFVRLLWLDGVVFLVAQTKETLLMVGLGNGIALVQPHPCRPLVGPHFRCDIKRLSNCLRISKVTFQWEYSAWHHA